MKKSTWLWLFEESRASGYAHCVSVLQGVEQSKASVWVSAQGHARGYVRRHCGCADTFGRTMARRDCGSDLHIRAQGVLGAGWGGGCHQVVVPHWFSSTVTMPLCCQAVLATLQCTPLTLYTVRADWYPAALITA